MSTDGFANSYKNEEEFAKTCMEYFEMVNQYGTKAVEENLKKWLSETSIMGSGDDITVLMAYYSVDEFNNSTEETTSEKSDIVEDATEKYTEEAELGADVSVEYDAPIVEATEEKEVIPDA